MPKAIAPSKLVPGTTYTLQFGSSLQQATYEGVGMHNSNKPGPLTPYMRNGFASATYGDRFIFTVEGIRYYCVKHTLSRLRAGWCLRTQ